MAEKTLKYSLQHHKVIGIIYMKGMEITQRRIQVLSIAGDHIKALDLDKQEIRTFKTENILSAMDLKVIEERTPGGAARNESYKQRS